MARNDIGPSPSQPPHTPPVEGDVPEKARKPVQPDTPLEEMPGEADPAGHQPGRD